MRTVHAFGRREEEEVTPSQVAIWILKVTLHYMFLLELRTCKVKGSSAPDLKGKKPHAAFPFSRMQRKG